MRSGLALLIVAGLALAPVSVRADVVTWQRWMSIPGVIDVGGPRNGFLVVAGSAALYLVHPEGEVATFARGCGRYHDDPGAQAHVALPPAAPARPGNSRLRRARPFILRPAPPCGATRVEAGG